jgi:hypothetical protein
MPEGAKRKRDLVKFAGRPAFDGWDSGGASLGNRRPLGVAEPMLSEANRWAALMLPIGFAFGHREVIRIMRCILWLATLASLIPLPLTARGEETLDSYFQTLAFERYEKEQAASEIQLASACGDATGCPCGSYYTGDFSKKCSYMYDCLPPCEPVNVCPSCEPSGPDRCCCTRLGWNLWQTSPAWTVRAGAIFLTRERPKQTPLLFDGSGTAELFNAKNFDFGAQAGFDGSFVRTFAGGNHAIEGRYFGVNDWTATQSFTAPASWNLGAAAFVPFAPGAPTGVLFNYDSNLNSGELNWRCRHNYWLDWLAGFRWVQLDESMRLDTNVGGPVAARFNTRNNLYGAQGGFDVRALGFNCPFFLGGTVKAGIYGNDASNNSAVTVSGSPLFDARAQRGVAAFVGEIDITGGYRFNPHVAVHGGYQFLWIENAAIASDQVRATNFASHNGINPNGDPLYMGAVTGLDITW